MKKYIISTALALAAISIVSAQTAGIPSTSAQRPSAAPQMMPPVITTGDATIDAQIKTLQKEMEAKIKVIRDEYQAKIKAVIGDKKILNQMKNGSTTPRMMREDGEGRASSSQRMMREENDGNGEGRGWGVMGSGSTTPPNREGMMRRASSTGQNGVPARREGNQMPYGQQVKGESTSGEAAQSQGEEGIRGFFGRLFGR